jgi:hypothetical protein
LDFEPAIRSGEGAGFEVEFDLEEAVREIQATDGEDGADGVAF